MYAAFPKDLKEAVSKVFNLILNDTYNKAIDGESPDRVEYLLGDSIVQIPYRIYYIDNSNSFINDLNSMEKMILHCIYSRSDDGFVRQKHLKSLLSMEYEDWAIPYIVKICDEYIVEILEMTYVILRQQDTERIKKFCHQNRVSFCKSYNRMISYWNEFYRNEHKNFKQYIGRKLFRECLGYSRVMENKQT
ncbi:hypothetical protein [Lysinibacillus xylanilyticus]|uniref:hypothetical protein n=1 Tax=Lysinibacillus xylanilyticus TaxID=582475 RepID=UPI003D043F03